MVRRSSGILYVRKISNKKMQRMLHFFIAQELQEWLFLNIKKQDSKSLSETFEWWILKRQV